MPSFLSKVFGRKKQDDKELSPGRLSVPSLLEGKFEAVSPTVSESAEKQPEALEQGKDAIGGRFLQRVKSASAAAPETATRSTYEPPPHLTLNLVGAKSETSTRPLGLVFEADPDAQIMLSEAVIGQRRLTPTETLALVNACSKAIVARGLETPGIMKPHWYTGSGLVQRRLISLFIHSLAPTASLTFSSSSEFESEIISTRSPHDIAAVLRWGIRHLQIEGSSFGKEPSWYSTFFDAEKGAQYPSNAFSRQLVSQIPPAHAELLAATLDLFSSLAAHAEANSISGSKISKLLGLWILEAERAEETDTWSTFYDRWEQAGRKMEHIFFANLRQDMLVHPLPKRLAELVKAYPYGQDPTDGLLPRPRFSTRKFKALYVHVDTELSTSAGPQHSRHPLRLICDALLAENTSDANEYVSLWSKIKEAGSVEDVLSSPVSRVFSDETVRLLSLIPGEKTPHNPSLTLVLPERKRSLSLGEVEKPAAAPNTLTLSTTTSTNGIGIDWVQFSTSGFLESGPLSTPLASTLMDSDIEVTMPRKPSKKGKTPSRKSLDMLPPISIPSSKEEPVAGTGRATSKITDLSSIEIDEAFIDFWNDALDDPIATGWPAFVVGRLKHSLQLEVAAVLEEGKQFEWVVIEQTFKRPAPPPATSTSETYSTGGTTSETMTKRATSPRPSFKSGNSSRKRFSFWTSPKKGKSQGKIGEMGEMIGGGRSGESLDGLPSSSKKDKRKSMPAPVPEEPSEVDTGVSGAHVGTSVAIASAAAATSATVIAATSPPTAEPAVNSVAPEEPSVAKDTCLPSTKAGPEPVSSEASGPDSVPKHSNILEANVAVVDATIPAEVPPEMTPVVEEPSFIAEAATVVADESVLSAPAIEEPLVTDPVTKVAPAEQEESLAVPAVEEELVAMEESAVPQDRTVVDEPASLVVEDATVLIVEAHPEAEKVSVTLEEPTPEEAVLKDIQPADEIVEPPSVEETFVDEITAAPVDQSTQEAAPIVEPTAPVEAVVGEAVPVDAEVVPDSQAIIEDSTMVDDAPVIDETPVPQPSSVNEEPAPVLVVEETPVEPLPAAEEVSPLVVEQDIALIQETPVDSEPQPTGQDSPPIIESSSVESVPSPVEETLVPEQIPSPVDEPTEAPSAVVQGPVVDDAASIEQVLAPIDDVEVATSSVEEALVGAQEETVVTVEAVPVVDVASPTPVEDVAAAVEATHIEESAPAEDALVDDVVEDVAAPIMASTKDSTLAGSPEDVAHPIVEEPTHEDVAFTGPELASHISTEPHPTPEPTETITLPAVLNVETEITLPIIDPEIGNQEEPEKEASSAEPVEEPKEPKMPPGLSETLIHSEGNGVSHD